MTNSSANAFAARCRAFRSARKICSLRRPSHDVGRETLCHAGFRRDRNRAQKLDKTGSVLIGKLSMVELAGGPGYRMAGASLFGPGLNPWDRHAGRAVRPADRAARLPRDLVPFALGSETSGSIITPSAFCGVTGLRPTYGLVSRYGAMALSWTMDKIGPMCRSAEDCGLVLQVIAGGDSKDPARPERAFYYTPQYARKLSDLKVGFAPADMDGPTPKRVPRFDAAMQVIRDTGVQLVEAKLCRISPMALLPTSSSARRMLGLRIADHQRQGE